MSAFEGFTRVCKGTVKITCTIIAGSSVWGCCARNDRQELSASASQAAEAPRLPLYLTSPPDKPEAKLLSYTVVSLRLLR